MRSGDTSLWFGGEKKAEAVTPRGGGDSLASLLPSFLWTWSNGPQAEQAACGVEEASWSHGHGNPSAGVWNTEPARPLGPGPGPHERTRAGNGPSPQHRPRAPPARIAASGEQEGEIAAHPFRSRIIMGTRRQLSDLVLVLLRGLFVNQTLEQTELTALFKKALGEFVRK